MNALHQTLADLIRINSVNSFYEGGPGEADAIDFIERFFAGRGMTTVRQKVFEATSSTRERSNLIVKLPGKNSHHRIILEAHVDTVSVQGMAIPPFEPRVQEGLMFGRGSCDTKAGLAGMMQAVADLHDRGEQPACEVWLAAVVDEEFSFRGVSKLCENVQAQAAIVAEPTEMRLVVASKGVLRWRVVAKGKSAHSSKTHLGINAIYHMARVALEFEKDHARLSAFSHPLLGPASCNVGKIHGGVQVNFVPDECAIEIDRRLLPTESVDDVWNHYLRMLEDLRAAFPTMNLHMEEPMLVDEAWTVDPNSSVVQVASNVLKKQGHNAEPCGVPFGSDASKLGRAGVPCIIFGPGSIDQAHAAVEFVDLHQVTQAYEFYREFLLSFEA